MKNKGLVAIAIYLIMMFVAGFGFGWTVYEEKYEELKKNYDVLEIQYKRDLEDCQTMFGDYQDRVEAGCFVNGGWNCE
jgi:nitrogen fixation-related uncharacterized protein